MSGMQDPEFQKLVRDIYEFQWVHETLQSHAEPAER
jgi:hypothetical protein